MEINNIVISDRIDILGAPKWLAKLNRMLWVEGLDKGRPGKPVPFHRQASVLVACLNSTNVEFVGCLLYGLRCGADSGQDVPNPYPPPKSQPEASLGDSTPEWWCWELGRLLAGQGVRLA